MKRLSDSARLAMTFNPLRASSRQSAGGGSRRSKVSRLPAIDLIGASELFISWPSTLTSRCQALRSSSRRVRLRSVRTRSSWGRPRSRKLLRRTPQRPVPPGKVEGQRRVLIGIETDREAQILARRPSNLSIGWRRRFSPARLTRRSRRSGSKVKTATSISAMMVRSSAVASKAPRRWDAQGFAKLN